jgi:hypothetical protein
MNATTAKLQQIVNGMSERMQSALTFYAENNAQGSTARTNAGNGGGTHGALIRRGLVGQGVNQNGRTGYFLTPLGWAVVEYLTGSPRPADEGRATLEEALVEAYPGNEPAEEAPATCPHRIADMRGGRAAELGTLPACEAGATYGAWSEGAGGFIFSGDCAVDVANFAADVLRQLAKDDDTDKIEILPVCREHEEQPAGSCEECAQEPEDEDADGDEEEAEQGCGAVDAGDLDACGRCADCTPQAGAELAGRVVEGTVVTHDGTAQGSAPKHATDPDVVAARQALDGLAVATITDHHDLTDPTEEERETRGYIIQPRGHGRVAVYWLEGGRIVRRDTPLDGAALDCLEDRLKRRGWTTEKMLRSSQCVFAHRPQAAPEAPAEPAARDRAEVEQAARHGCTVPLYRALQAQGKIPAAQPEPAEATAPKEEEFTEHQARAIVEREYPSASGFKPYRGQGGKLLGYTFQVGQLHSARYGWITPAGRYSKGLEAYRSTAADMLVHADREANQPPAPEVDLSNPRSMSTNDLLAYLRAAMEDVPEGDLIRNLWEELDKRMSGCLRPPSDWR